MRTFWNIYSTTNRSILSRTTSSRLQNFANNFKLYLMTASSSSCVLNSITQLQTSTACKKRTFTRLFPWNPYETSIYISYRLLQRGAVLFSSSDWNLYCSFKNLAQPNFVLKTFFQFNLLVFKTAESNSCLQSPVDLVLNFSKISVSKISWTTTFWNAAYSCFTKCRVIKDNRTAQFSAFTVSQFLFNYENTCNHEKSIAKRRYICTY